MCKPEEDVGFPSAGVTGSCGLPDMVLGDKLLSSTNH